MKRKRSELNTVVTLIIILFCAILSFFVIQKIVTTYSGKTPIDICRLSVLTQAETARIPAISGEKSPFSIDCDTRYVHFYNDRVETGYKIDKTSPMEIMYNGKKVKEFGSLNEYIVNQVIAEEMRICYYQFGAGKLHVFDNSIYGNNDVCFICSQIDFKDVPNTIPQRQYTGLMEYFNKTYIKNEKMTYFQYFNQNGVSIPWKTFVERIGNINIDTTETYAVIFTKQDRRLGVLITQGLLSVVGVSPTGSSSALNSYYVYALPAKSINDRCDVIAN